LYIWKKPGMHQKSSADSGAQEVERATGLDEQMTQGNVKDTF